MKPCSGLGSIAPCEKREFCANYRHWTEDPRSEFNICTVTGKPFKFFVPIGAPLVQKPAAPSGQLGLF